MPDTGDGFVRYAVSAIEEVNTDIDDLAAFYREIAGEESAQRFEGAIEEVMKSLSFMPYSHPMWEDDDSVRRINMASHKQSIIYLVLEDVLQVVAVKAFHTLQDPIKTKTLLGRRISKARSEHQSST